MQQEKPESMFYLWVVSGFDRELLVGKGSELLSAATPGMLITYLMELCL
jgi:hypothetical protein